VAVRMWPVFVSLVALCWTGVSKSSMECPWNKFHLGRINNKIIFLLENMVRHTPTTPHTHTHNINNCKEDSVPILALKTLQLFSQVFDGNQTSMPWNPMTVRLLNNLVFRQTNNLQQCVGSSPFFCDLRCPSVFQNQKCAWELRRYEFRLAFAQLKRFLDNRRKPNSTN
uniref:Uncharacterized protein n=1 Tax=Gadus morhua TaxID=8049 RepID=A0A8C5CQC3_GADMO